MRQHKRPGGANGQDYCSFVVDAEHDARAEQCTVGVCERGEIVVVSVPKALRGHTHALTVHLPNNGLDNNLVAVNAQLLDGVFNVVSQLLGQELGLLVIVDFLIR